MAQSHLDHNRALFKAGMATKAEVLRGEVQLAQTNINLTKARQGLELTKNNFNNVLGKDLDSLVELAETSFEAGTTVFYDYPVLLATAFENRPEWKQYILNQQIKADELRVAYSGLLPSVSLTGNLNGGLTRYAAYQSDTTSWTALLSASWNIFDVTATLNKIKEAEAKLEAEKAREMTLKLNLSLEVKNANFVLKSAKENLESTAKALELAEENFKVADLRYNEGAGGNLEVIDAQVALTRARVDNVNARHDLLLAKARINKVLGKEIYQ
jgi:outer membrane protein TolC